MTASPIHTPEQRAQKLLLSYLSPHQKMTYLAARFFYVRARSLNHGHYYAITGGGQIYGLNAEGFIVRRHSMYPAIMLRRGIHEERFPDADLALGNLLWLKAVGNPRFCATDVDSSGNRTLDSRQHFAGFLAELNSPTAGRTPPSAVPMTNVEAPPPDYWPPTGGLWGDR